MQPHRVERFKSSNDPKFEEKVRDAPASGSWLNQVEGCFGLITDKMIRRGTFRSADELERAIYAWLASWNDQPKAFVWKATPDVILDKVRRCKGPL